MIKREGDKIVIFLFIFYRLILIVGYKFIDWRRNQGFYAFAV